MAVINVALGDRSYPVYVEAGCLGRIGAWLVERGFQRVHIVSQSGIWHHYGPALTASLSAAGLPAGENAVSLVPDGEEAKTWAVAGRLHDDLISRGLERGDVVIALGGGVVGDLGGFVAATYLRGIPFVQVPTSLLAQVDASVGGKTGVNHPRGKNLIGAFHQPVAVFADPDTLRTLPAAELRAGLAECVKHGVIASADYLQFIETELPALLARDSASLTTLVAESVRTKARIVAADEREAGLRATLNFGHTVAHALEAAVQFTWRHGEAVAAGIVAAAELSVRLGLCSPELAGRLAALLARAGLPVQLPPLPAETLLAAAAQDKKRRGGRLTWIVVRAPGDVVVRQDVPDDVVLQTLRARGAS